MKTLRRNNGLERENAIRYALRFIRPDLLIGAVWRNRGNIIKISQTVIRGYFNLIMVVQIASPKGDFASFGVEGEGACDVAVVHGGEDVSSFGGHEDVAVDVGVGFVNGVS